MSEIQTRNVRQNSNNNNIRRVLPFLSFAFVSCVCSSSGNGFIFHFYSEVCAFETAWLLRAKNTNRENFGFWPDLTSAVSHSQVCPFLLLLSSRISTVNFIYRFWNGCFLFGILCDIYNLWEQKWWWQSQESLKCSQKKYNIGFKWKCSFSLSQTWLVSSKCNFMYDQYAKAF